MVTGGGRRGKLMPEESCNLGCTSGLRFGFDFGFGFGLGLGVRVGVRVGASFRVKSTDSTRGETRLGAHLGLEGRSRVTPL